MINRKFLHFNTRAAFDRDFVNIPYDSIVFIKDSRQIYTHGAFYSCIKELKSNPEISWSVNKVTIIIGTQFELPEISNPHNLDISYSSSDNTIAAVDEHGFIEIKNKKGVANITAIFAGNDTYEPARLTCQVAVVKSDPDIRWSVASDEVIITDTGHAYPYIINSESETFMYTYGSSNHSVATIDSNGNITIVGVGTTVISATSAEEELFDSKKISYTLIVRLAVQTIHWSEPSATVQIGNENNNFPILTNQSGKQIKYSSSNSNIASIIVNTGKITLHTPGSVTITASTVDDSQSTSYMLNISELPLMVWYKNGVAVLTDLVNLGDGDHSYPTLQIAPEYLNYVTILYTTTNSAVATINQNGYVSLHGVGSTIIRATSSVSIVSGHEYSSKTVEYSLQVNAQPVQPISWSSSTATVSKGYNSNKFPTLNNVPSGASVTYTSSATNVATINSSGTPTLKSPGTCIITATANGTSATYTLTINEYPNISWSKVSDTVQIGESGHSYPTLNNPNGVGVTYSSSNTNVATIANGQITLKAAGNTTISATSTATSQYSSQVVSYTLTIQQAPTETFSVGYGYRLIGSANFVFNYKDNATTVADEYIITVPGDPDNPNDPNARLVLSVPAKSSGNEITRIEYNSILGKEDVTSQFTRFISNGKAYYWSSEDRPFIPGTHRLVVS